MKHNGAVKRITTTTNPVHLAQEMVAQMDRHGFLRIAVTVQIHPVELLVIMRKARHLGTTVDDVIGTYLNGGNGDGGILDSLREYEHELPDNSTMVETRATPIAVNPWLEQS